MSGRDTVAEEESQPNRVQVVVRVRPVLPHELSDDVAVTCSPDARRLQVLLPERLAGGAAPLPGTLRSGARSYEFDACLAGSTTQAELFEVCGMQELVEAALDGYCVTIFAFGQTGSGKTHSIIGPRLSRGAGGAAATRLGSAGAAAAAGVAADDLVSVPGSAGSASQVPGSNPAGSLLIDPEDGVLTRCIAAAYRSMAARSAASGVEWNVSASVLELYNEAVTDLLAADKNKTLQVRKDARDGFAVAGLTQAACPTDVSALRVLVRALQHRHTRAHKLNEYSSRSHCLMTFVFASKEAAAGEGGAEQGAKGGVRRYGKLCLVDLAGSERLKDTGNTERGAVRETGAINKSLFTLGQVLAALSARSSAPASSAAASSFVPYRDSKLTQLLWDGLRGSGRCLMLACLGPMRAAAEESLNTLHFATLATRIKAEPVVLLDPQDQLVLDLRKVITQLRQENTQLAGALQQLSAGADPAAVMAGLPEALRATAASAAAAQAAQAAAAAGVAAATPPPRPPPLQPLAGSSGRALLSSADAASSVGRSSAPDSAEAGGYGVPSSSSPLSSPTQHVGSGGRGLRLSVSHGSPLRGRFDGLDPNGQVPRSAPAPLSDPQTPSSVAAATIAGHRHRIKEAWASSNGGGRGGSHKQLMPTAPSPYGRSSPSPARAAPASSDGVPSRYGGGGGGGRATGARGSASPLRARSVGRNVAAAAANGGGVGGASSRPAYLTADPGALLYGYSNGAPLPSPSASSGVGSGASVASPPPPLRGSSDHAMAPPPPPAFAEFPELAALEAEFQQLLATGGPGAGGSLSGAGRAGVAGGRGGATRREPGAQGAAGGSGGGAAVEGAADGAGGAEAEGPRPDVRALKWAERNAWFGTDYDMTAFAYQVHDQLVEAEGVDPISDTYYMEIERRVAERFPDKWAVAMRGQLPGGSGAAAAAGLRRAAPNPGQPALPQPQRPMPSPPRRPPPPPPPPAQNFGAGLRVSLKEPLHRSGSSGGPGAGGGAAASAASLAAQAAAVRARQGGFGPQGQTDDGGALVTPTQAAYANMVTQFGHSFSHESSHAASNASSHGFSHVSSQLSHASVSSPPLTAGSSSTEPSTPGTSGYQVNPFNIGALHAAAPPKASRFAPVPDRGRGMAMGQGAADAGSDARAVERIQKEYARQRAALVEELRVAKEEAEVERQRILARIHRAAGGSKWR